MAKKTTVTPRFKKPHPPNFIREWREFRNLTQKDLADRVFMTESSISQIENRKQGYSDTTLYAVAEALRCSPGDLLTRNPMDESAPWSIWDSIPETDRPHVLRLLKSYAKDGTNG